MNADGQGLAPATLAALRRARLLALDVDGVLTNGRVVYSDAGETQRFHVHDGQGLVWLMRAGVRVVWITGRGCAATERRAAELGIDELHAGAGPKGEVLAGAQARFGIPPEDTVVMGDDLPDLAMGARAALLIAPADARREVREAADLVTRAAGGRGAVRELVEHLLGARGRWQDVVDAHGG